VPTRRALREKKGHSLTMKKLAGVDLSSVAGRQKEPLNRGGKKREADVA